jgi:hypothetical protein
MVKFLFESLQMDLRYRVWSRMYRLGIWINVNVQGGPEIANAIRDLTLPTIVIPEYPRPSSATATINPGEVFLWQQDITKAEKRIVLLAENKKCSYALILGQCSSELVSKIKGADLYI